MHRAFGLLPAAIAAAVLWSADAAAETPLERGTYLVRGIVGCGNCHTQQGPEGPVGPELGGGLVIEEPGVFHVVTPNITPDPETGIGNWTDEQLAKAIREGVRPDGTILGPPMPFEQYRGLSDSDLAAIIAYVRSVPPAANEVARSEYFVPLPPSWGPPVGSVPDVPRDDPVAYGAYLAGPIGHCVECHTPMVGPMFDYEHQFLRGGFKFHGPWGISVSRNITSHPEDGLGAWTDEEIKTAITTGVSRDGTKLAPPMGFYYYKNISEADLDALVAYLRTVPPLEDAE
jgi:mono/diheme cytochrome c family protein